jgi:predicted O-methyltransferase YrrM
MTRLVKGSSAAARHARERLGAALEGLEGWLLPEEAEALFESALRAARTRRGATVVEIGSWKGRSTVALALGVREGGTGTVYAVDPFAGTDLHSALGQTDTFGDFLRAIDSRGVGDLVQPIRSTAHQARPRFADGSIDLLFVDGAHDFDSVLLDIDDWTTALRPGAVIAFNDFQWPGVHAALRARVLCRGAPFRRPRLHRNTLLLSFHPGARWTSLDSCRLAALRTTIRLRSLAFVLATPATPGSPARAVSPGRLLPRPLLRAGRRLSERLVNAF